MFTFAPPGPSICLLNEVVTAVLFLIIYPDIGIRIKKKITVLFVILRNRKQFGSLSGEEWFFHDNTFLQKAAIKYSEWMGLRCRGYFSQM